jgi:hypothetical protein
MAIARHWVRLIVIGSAEMETEAGNVCAIKNSRSSGEVPTALRLRLSGNVG